MPTVTANRSLFLITCLLVLVWLIASTVSATPVVYDLTLPGVTGSITTDGVQGVLRGCTAATQTCYRHPEPQDIVDWDISLIGFNFTLTPADSAVSIAGGAFLAIGPDLTYNFDADPPTDIVFATPIDLIHGNTLLALITHDEVIRVGEQSELFAFGGVQTIAVDPPAIPEPGTLVLLGVGLCLVASQSRRLRHA